MEFIFTPEHVVINDLFTRDIKYKIPEYQRPYSWDCLGKSDKNNQINTMWDDLINFYDAKEKGEYFFGSMVLIDKGNREFEVIDGQQRLTTINILIASIKAFVIYLLTNNKTIITADDDQIKQKLIMSLEKDIQRIDEILYNTVDYGLEQERKLKIEKFNGFDFDKILSLSLECKNVEDVNFTNASAKQINTALKYFNNRDYFVKKFKKRFIINNKFSSSNRMEMSKFFEFLKNQISVVRIKTPEFGIAYQIFEILNNRRLPLSNKDLMRNFIIKEFDNIKKNNPKYKNIKPSDKWTEIDQNFMLDTDFLSRFVENRKATQQKYSAFNDLQELYKTYTNEIDRTKIEKLYEHIKQDLTFYSMINEENIQNKEIRNKILFLINAENQRYILNLLIALFRAYNYDGKNNPELKLFINTFEIYIIYMLLNPLLRFSYTQIYASISFLNKNDIDNARKQFELQKTEIDELKKFINNEIRDNYTAKLLIAKYLWSKDAEINEDIIEQYLNFNLATLEHIIPLNPEKDSNWLTDFSLDFRTNFTYRLGNMTLLTKTINSKAKNYDFKFKKIEYLKTKLNTTHIIANLINIDELFIENRHKEIINVIFNNLNI